jgi:23S rRNA pseudouridine2604 synthase
VAIQRVAKIMAARGLCSRREAEQLIAAGCVLVNGEVVETPGVKATTDADIRLTEAGREHLEQRLTIVLHKPLGVVSTQPETGQTPAWRLVRAETARGAIEPAVRARLLANPSRLSVAGRLDRASRGLLVLTDDGAVARRIIGGQQLEKTYLVRAAEPVTDGQLAKLNGSLRLDGAPLRPMRVTRHDATRLRFVLVEGKKHQIRRCCRTVGLTVTDLLRTAIGPLRLGTLPEGCWRVATAQEVAQLRTGRRAEDEGARGARRGARGRGDRRLP